VLELNGTETRLLELDAFAAGAGSDGETVVGTGEAVRVSDALENDGPVHPLFALIPMPRSEIVTTSFTAVVESLSLYTVGSNAADPVIKPVV